MVAPIHFNNRLIGVLGIGKVKNPTGNERNLMKIICDIAGVTLANQSYLKEWKHGSMKDSLTGLYNRRYFFYMVMKHVEKSVVRGFPISICMFDIDHFKNYNDTNGHQKGDILLRELSDLISRLSRRDSVLARYGGEEFIVMLPDIPKEEAFRYAERVKEEIEKYPFLHGETQPIGHVSISGGVATFPEDAGSIETVIKWADKALYRAKKEGRNRVIKHESSRKLVNKES
jgi:diguanylate cyclase (GGDEF)-like protein